VTTAIASACRRKQQLGTPAAPAEADALFAAGADGPFADDLAAAHAAVHRRAHEHPSRAAGRRPLYCEVPR